MNSQQKLLDFEENFIVSTKYLVYADIKYVRQYYEDKDNDDIGIKFATPKTEYKTEQIPLGVIDNNEDVVNLYQFIKKTKVWNHLQWNVESIKLRTKTIDYFQLET